MNRILEQVLMIGSITIPLAIVFGVVINALIQDDTMHVEITEGLQVGELQVDEMTFESL